MEVCYLKFQIPFNNMKNIQLYLHKDFQQRLYSEHEALCAFIMYLSLYFPSAGQ